MSSDNSIKLPNWGSKPFSFASMDRDSAEFAQLVDTYVPGRESSLTKLLEVSEVLGNEGVDLLNRLLSVDPDTRISASEALAHPYF